MLMSSNVAGATSDPGYISALAPSFTMAKPAISGGAFSSPSSLGPMLTSSADILWPATIQYNLNPSGESSFHDKPSHKIVWRGSLDGIHVHPVKDWRASQRFRLVSLATSNDRTSARVVRMTKKDFWGKEYQYDVVTTLGALNARYSNIRATGQPVQCDPVLCEHIATNTEFVERSSLEDMAKNRFVMDVDGNSCVPLTQLMRNGLMTSPVETGIVQGSERISCRIKYRSSRPSLANGTTSEFSPGFTTCVSSLSSHQFI
jgi:hypothetical protein